MADDVENWLIDLDCSIGENVPVLLSLPIINSPSDGKVSHDDNPFNTSLQAINTLDDLFERTPTKVQQFENEKSEEFGMVAMEDSNKCNNGALTSGIHGTEAFAMTNKGREVTELKKVVSPNENKTNFRAVEGVDLLRHLKESAYDSKTSPEITHNTESHYRQPAIDDSGVIQLDDISTINDTEVTNSVFSPESRAPKYCSTPLNSNKAPSKGKVRAEVSPRVSNRKSLKFGNLSPTSFIKIRVETCVANTINKYRSNREASVHIQSPQNFRRSLDSQMCNYTSHTSSFQQDTNFIYGQTPRRSYQEIIGNLNANNLFSSDKSWQMQIEESFPCNKSAESSKWFKYSAPEATDIIFQEAQRMSKLFKEEAESHSSNCFETKYITLIETDTEES